MHTEKKQKTQVTLTFNLWPSNLIGFVRISSYMFVPKFYQTKCSGSWIIVCTEKKLTKTILSVVTADSTNYKLRSYIIDTWLLMAASKFIDLCGLNRYISALYFWFFFESGFCKLDLHSTRDPYYLEHESICFRLPEPESIGTCACRRVCVYMPVSLSAAVRGCAAGFLCLISAGQLDWDRFRPDLLAPTKRTRTNQAKPSRGTPSRRYIRWIPPARRDRRPLAGGVRSTVSVSVSSWYWRRRRLGGGNTRGRVVRMRERKCVPAGASYNEQIRRRQMKRQQTGWHNAETVRPVRRVVYGRLMVAGHVLREHWAWLFHCRKSVTTKRSEL